MNNTKSNRESTSDQVTNEPAATSIQTTSQHQPTANSKTEELRSHPGITIKWSLDSDCRRSADVPVGPRWTGVLGGAAWHS